MEVTVTKFRAELAAWLDRVRRGEEVVITERGSPVARLAPVDSVGLLDRLAARGELSRPQAARPVARRVTRVAATEPVSDLVAEQRR